MRLNLMLLFSKLLNKFISFYWLGVYASFRKKYQVSETFLFNGQQIFFYGDGEIVCGDKSYIGDRSTIQVSSGYKISIGNGCQISSNVRIFTQTDIADSDFSIKPIPTKRGDVLIGDYCWIGANVVINPGILIGNNVVVGANSVVTKSIPDNQIWGGVPAKLIREKNKTLTVK